MNKATIKAFILWLENSSDSEIEARRQLILSKMNSVSRDGMSDMRLALRLIDEEIIARIELGKLASDAVSIALQVALSLPDCWVGKE